MRAWWKNFISSHEHYNTEWLQFAIEGGGTLQQPFKIKNLKLNFEVCNKGFLLYSAHSDLTSYTTPEVVL